MTRAIRMTLLFLLVLPLVGCAVSKEREIEIGRQMAPQVEEQLGGLVNDPQLQQYVQDVGMSLVDNTDRRNLPWQFRVLDSSQVNALAVPGGKIYITQGLLRRLENEAQLAAILGHEIAHVTERHSVDQMKQAQLVRGGALLAGVAAESPAVGNVAAAAGKFALLSYSRDQERQADEIGLSLLAEEGYRPDAMIEVMQVLRAAGGDGPPQFFSSHPSPENRLDYLREAVDERYSEVLTAGETHEDRFERYVGP